MQCPSNRGQSTVTEENVAELYDLAHSYFVNEGIALAVVGVDPSESMNEDVFTVPLESLAENGGTVRSLALHDSETLRQIWHSLLPIASCGVEIGTLAQQSWDALRIKADGIEYQAAATTPMTCEQGSALNNPQNFFVYANGECTTATLCAQSCDAYIHHHPVVAELRCPLRTCPITANSGGRSSSPASGVTTAWLVASLTQLFRIRLYPAPGKR